MAIRINSSLVRENIEKVQQEMVKRDQRLEPLMVSLDKLHFTLMVMRLSTTEEEERYVYYSVHTWCHLASGKTWIANYMLCATKSLQENCSF